MEISQFEFELRKRGFIGSMIRGYSDGTLLLKLNSQATHWSITRNGTIVDEGTTTHLYRIFETIDHLRSQY